MKLSGPMNANIQIVKELLAELENGLRVENQNFAQVVEGSKVSYEEIVRRAQTGWYITAREAVDLHLVAGVV